MGSSPRGSWLTRARASVAFDESGGLYALALSLAGLSWAGCGALLSEDEITAATGESGRLMRFGRDLSSRTYRYTVAVFVTEAKIFIVEAGGREDLYEPREAEIERAIGAITLR